MNRTKIKKIRRAFSNYRKNKRMVGTSKNQTVSETERPYRINSRKLSSTSRIISEINLRDILYLQLNNKEKKIIDLRYEKRLSVLEICDYLYISESSYFRKMRRINKKLIKYYDIFEEIF